MILRVNPSRVVRGLSLAAALLLLAPGSRAEDTVVSGTLPEDYLPGLKSLVHAAVKESPTMILQQIQLAQSEAGLLAGDASLYPQLSGSVGYGASNESVGVSGEAGGASSKSTGTSKSFTYSVSASQNLFQWGAVWKQTRIAKLQLLIQQKSYAEAYRSFVVQLRDLYLGLIMKKLALRNAHFNLKIVEAQLAISEDQLKSGMISQGGILGPRLAAEDTRLGVDRIDEDYAHSKRMLAQFAGVPDIDEDTIPIDVPAVTPAPATGEALLAEFLRDGAKSTFTAENYAMYVKQQQLNYEIALVRQLPKFAAYGSYSLSNSTSISLANPVAGQAPVPAAIAQEAVKSESYGISASVDIFDGFATTAAMRSAKDSKHYYERTLQTYLETTMEAAQDARRQVEFSGRAMKLAETRYDLAKSAFDEAQEDLKLGTITQAFVDSTTYQLYYSAWARASARADFLSHWSAYVSLVDADPALNELPVHYVRPTR